MRAKWYGDKHDLVKWSTLLELAHRAGVQKVLQVTCLVPDGYKGTVDERALLVEDFGAEIADVVWQHFRSLESITELGAKPGVEVTLVPDEYPVPIAERDDYFEMVAEKWLRPDRGPMIVFLDPDTGLGATRTHVLPRQLETIRRALKAGDWLVFYQHAPKYKLKGVDWRERAQQNLAEALDVHVADVVRRACNAAKDVLFLAWEATGAVCEGESTSNRLLGGR
jgi:hypothetical protein